MITENTIELSLIEQLIQQGYVYKYGVDISPNGNEVERTDYSTVLIEREIREAMLRLNPSVPQSALDEAYLKLTNLEMIDVMANNEVFHNYLTQGITVEYQKGENTVGVAVQLVDFDKVENNVFWAVNQLTIIENNTERRPDVLLYINGLPLVLIELKDATNEKATIDRAYNQIQSYKKQIPTLFYYNALCVISDGIDAKCSSLSAPFSRFLTWKSPGKNKKEVRTDLQILTHYLLDKETLLKVIRYCTVFEKEEKKDEKTGLIYQIKVKKIAAYHQYYAVQKAIDQTIRATHHTDGDRKVGVVWHTQGSGKSLSMVFYSGQLITHPEMENPTLVVLTDRNDLDDQLFMTFGNCIELLRQTPAQAENRAHLKELLKVSGGGVIFTTIQKFSPEEGNVYDTLSERTNIVVMADEAHRSQYGFKGREVEVEGGSEIRYGNAKYMRDALPNASYIGFTGTPIEKDDKSTPAVFGKYIDIYDIKQAVDDGATVPLSYEARLSKVRLNQEQMNTIDADIDAISDATDEQLDKAKKKVAVINSVIGNKERLEDVAKDIVYHFEERQKVFEGKAMIVCMTREICANLYNEIKALRPDWHSDDIEKGKIKVVMTSSSDDKDVLTEFATTKKERKNLALRMKDPNDELQLVIVRDMWLTGFDAPSMHTMYVDKKMQGANLMQAIARVNRVYKDKPGGLIVDYIGIGHDLKTAMATYMENGGQGTPIQDMKEAKALLAEKLEIVEQMFNGFDYMRYFAVDTAEKLQVLLGAQNFIMQDEDLKNRFLKQVTLLSKVYVLTIPSDEAEVVKDVVAFFQAVKSRINKFTPSGGKSNYEVETAIRQIVDAALASDGVVDIYEAAGIKTPSVSILSDEFLQEVKNMQQKNIAYELLKKLLGDEVRVRKTKNIAQGKRFSEMLESIVNRYHNNQIDSAQVIEELGHVAKELNLEDLKADQLGLTEEEYAFYSVLKENDSTSFLEDHKMKELIHAIVGEVRSNATVDWQKRDDVRAQLRLSVKKILLRYGYPPDLAKMEADRVIAQGESLAGRLTKTEGNRHVKHIYPQSEDNYDIAAEK